MSIVIEKNLSVDQQFDIYGEDEAHIGYIVHEDGEFKIEDICGKLVGSAANFDEAVRSARIYFE